MPSIGFLVTPTTCIKGVLILKRNATRDYLDFVALGDHMGDERSALALQTFDWNTVKAACAHISTVIFDRVCDLETGRSDGPRDIEP